PYALLHSPIWLHPALLHCHRHFPSDATAHPLLSTLSLHDALPISIEIKLRCSTETPLISPGEYCCACGMALRILGNPSGLLEEADRKSTRLNSSHVSTSYAVFCLKQKIS